MIRVVVVDSDEPAQHLAMIDLHVEPDTGEAAYEFSASDATGRATAIQALQTSIEILEME